MISLNGELCDIDPGEALTAALTRLGVSANARGVAVAVDGEVVPRSDWDTYPLPDRAQVEVLTAMQGG